MNCDFVTGKIRAFANQSMSDREWIVCVAHIESCPDCRAALRGAEALVEIKNLDTGTTPAQLFTQAVNVATRETGQHDGKRRFWMGAGFGGAIAASLFAMALTFGWLDDLRSNTPAAAEFVLALNETRQMNVAFETDRQLRGATISILLSGDVEIEGYGAQRELTWAEDLDAGVNRLSLPVFASGLEGGQIVVRLMHPKSKQFFVVNLRTES